jgi:hypothetical protein
MSEVLVGLIGLIIGAVIGGIFDMYANHRREKFEAYKDVRVSLNNMYEVLIKRHSSIQKFYSEKRNENSAEKIIELKDYHWTVMEIYKEFRIYFGDLKAYELQSALYNYYYEFVLAGKTSKRIDDYYEISYQALKDAYGMMLNDVKLGLISMKFIKDDDKNNKKDKSNEYKRYSDRLINSIKVDFDETEVAQRNDSQTPLEKAQERVIEKIKEFENEYSKKSSV